MPKHLIVCCTLVFLGATTPTTQAATAYISDELTVPLRSGPSGGHRIIHRGLPSGTTLETISVDEEAGFTQIRTQRGTEGWIRSQYLVTEPIAKMKLASAQRQAARLEQRLADAQEEIKQLNQSNQQQVSTNQQGSARIRSLEQELARIKEISAGAIATHEENIQLKEINARLGDELDDISEARDRLEDNESNQALMLGAGFVFLGLIAGVLIKARPQRSAWT